MVLFMVDVYKKNISTSSNATIFFYFPPSDMSLVPTSPIVDLVHSQVKLPCHITALKVTKRNLIQRLIISCLFRFESWNGVVAAASPSPTQKSRGWPSSKTSSLYHSSFLIGTTKYHRNTIRVLRNITQIPRKTIQIPRNTIQITPLTSN